MFRLVSDRAVRFSGLPAASPPGLHAVKTIQHMDKDRMDVELSTQRKRLLLIGPLPPPYAGPETAMQSTINSRVADEFDIAVLNTNFRRRNDEKGRLGLGMAMAFIAFIVRFVFRLISFRPDGVYAFVTATRLGWMGRDIWCIFLARLFRTAPIIHMRAGHFRVNWLRATVMERWFIRRACRTTALNLVQAPSLRDQFAGLAPAERIVAVPNMVDTDTYFNATPTECDRMRVLFLGHLSFAKGYCDLLQAIPAVARVFPDVKFSFAGTRLSAERNVRYDPSSGESLRFIDPDECFRKTIAPAHESNYEYLGVIDQPRKLALLRACNCLVLPSYSEGFSMAVLEALAMAKPVVCTPVGALRDFVIHDRNGFIVPVGDIPALAAAVVRMIADQSARDRIAVTNHHYAREHFGTETVSQQLCAQIHSALGVEPEKQHRGVAISAMTAKIPPLPH